MSLYYEAASVLSGPVNSGSLKSSIYHSKWKSPPTQIFALITEAAKYDTFLKQVVDNSSILANEPKLTPLISILLTHDFFFAKRGLSAPVNHPLSLAIERHKVRLNAEFTKLRVRRGCATKDDLRRLLSDEHTRAGTFDPRWIRINNAKTNLQDELRSPVFASRSPVSCISDLSVDEKGEKYYLDEHIPDLLAVAPTSDITSSSAYINGQLILQNKASCFPAYLLLGDSPGCWEGDIIDACAAPGNKTTHLVSLLASTSHTSKTQLPRSEGKIFSADASKTRSKILQQMVVKAGVDDMVNVLAGQDFLALNPSDSRFSHVTGLLLDPSCSGSGIPKREDIPQLSLPLAKSVLLSSNSRNSKVGKKRKRGRDEPLSGTLETVADTDSNDNDATRLTKLANLQCQIIEHAFKFPAATRITYSTCSIHNEENEEVVSRVLQSATALSRGWKVLPRSDQPEGLRKWKYRGITTVALRSEQLTEDEREACIRCWTGDEEGTGGFFVAAFIRDAGIDEKGGDKEDEEEWEGFSS